MEKIDLIGFMELVVVDEALHLLLKKFKSKNKIVFIDDKNKKNN